MALRDNAVIPCPVGESRSAGACSHKATVLGLLLLLLLPLLLPGLTLAADCTPHSLLPSPNCIAC
jgi:hypothetical protein